MKQPMQPVVRADDGVIRFQQNEIICWLLASGRFNLNELSLLPFSADDQMQIAQMLGYSVSGFGDLGYATQEAVDAADAEAEGLISGMVTRPNNKNKDQKMAEDQACTYHATIRGANVVRQKEWDPGDKITLSYRGNEMAGEVGEACNVIKKLERERLGIVGSRETKEHLAEELADVVICADLIAMHEGIDLDAAVRRKFNATSTKNGLHTFMVQ